MESSLRRHAARLLPSSRLKRALGFLLLAPSLASAQSGVTGPAPVATPAPERRPGLWRLGPIYLTPRLQIGTIGLDTNVFYTPTERRTDLSANGGPGLELIAPLFGAFRLEGLGQIDYTYFARTTPLRRLGGTAGGWLTVDTERFQLKAGRAYTRSFSRLGIEVDQRVERLVRTDSVSVKQRLFGRTSAVGYAARSRDETEDGQTFLGTDLARTLTRDVDTVRGGLEYQLSIKTALLVEGEYEFDRFPLAPARDADQRRFAGGIRTDRTALIAGRAVAGVRYFRPKQAGAVERQALYADVDAMWNITAKTRLGGAYRHDLVYSTFDTTGETPTLTTQTIEARFEKDIFQRLELRLVGREVRILTDGAVRLTFPDGETVTQVRDDRSREGIVELLYRLRPRLQVGGTLSYIERRSTVGDFGIDGLLAGATVRFDP